MLIGLSGCLRSLHREVYDLRMRVGMLEADAADEQWVSSIEQMLDDRRVARICAQGAERLMSERKESAD
jgi:hypothetical protein